MNKNNPPIDPAHIAGEWLMGRMAIDINGNGILEEEDYCDDDALLTDEPFYTIVSFGSNGVATQTSVCGAQSITITFLWVTDGREITFTQDGAPTLLYIDKLTETEMILRNSAGSSVRWNIYDKVK